MLVFEENEYNANYKNEEFRKTEEYSQVIKQRFSRLYDNSSDLISTVNLEGTILDCNSCLAKHLGYIKDELIGKKISDIVSNKSKNTMLELFNEWLKTEYIKNKLVWLERKDHSTFPVLISANNIYDYNRILIGTNLIIRDVSEIYYNKKKITELEQKDRLKEKFAMMITHDLKTMINPIKGYCDLLRDPDVLGPLNSAQLEAINEICQNSKKLERLVSDIHDIQKIDMQQMSLANKSVNVNELFNMVYGPCKLLSIEKKIKIQCIFPNDEYFIHGDVDRVFQIFMNLIQNAIDFVPKKSGKIEIGICPQSKFIIFYVRDNGIGISAENQEKLFNEFYQIENKNIQHAGSGLGLAICRGLTKKMGGRIWVESKKGTGTTIYFSIPRVTKK